MIYRILKTKTQPRRRSILEQPKNLVMEWPHHWRPEDNLVILLPHQKAQKLLLLLEHQPLRGGAQMLHHCPQALVPEALLLASRMTDKEPSP